MADSTTQQRRRRVFPAVLGVGTSGGFLLLADGSSHLLLADGSSKLQLTGSAAAPLLLLADGSSFLLLADGASKFDLAA